MEEDDAQYRPKRAVARRGQVLLLVIVLTVVAMAAVYRAPGTAWARADVTLVLPASLGGFTAELPPWADLVSVSMSLERVLEDDMPHAFVADNAPFYAVVDEGRSIRQVDTGTQWAPHYSAPTLIVEVVAADPQEAQEMLATALDQIDVTLEELQVTEGLPAHRHITAMVDNVRLEHRLPSRSEIVRAWAAVGLLGFVAASVLCQLVQGRPRVRSDRLA